MDKEKDLLKRSRSFEGDKAAFDLNHKKVKESHCSEPIKLNIGGKKFSTTLDTLTKYRDSFFGAMFSGLIPLKPTQNGSYFIDRDGTYFHYILNYLRTGELIVPHNKPHLLRMLLLEAEFYQVEEVIIKLGGKTNSQPFAESIILPKTQSWFHEKLNEWAGCQPDQKWKLIYRGSRDGFQGENFRQRCVNKGATYTIAKSGDSIFGAYNPLPWSGSKEGDFANGRGSFLFSLVNIYNTPPLKLRNLDQKYGAFEADCLPSFGNADLLLSHTFSGTTGTNLFRNYHNPTKHHYLLTGELRFNVDEVEVFAENVKLKFYEP